MFGTVLSHDAIGSGVGVLWAARPLPLPLRWRRHLLEPRLIPRTKLRTRLRVDTTVLIQTTGGIGILVAESSVRLR